MYTGVSSEGSGAIWMKAKGSRSVTAFSSLCAGSSLFLPVTNPWDSGKFKFADQLISVVFDNIQAHNTEILGNTII